MVAVNFSDVLEALSNDVLMLCLAAIVYLLFARSYVPHREQNHRSSGTKHVQAKVSFSTELKAESLVIRSPLKPLRRCPVKEDKVRFKKESELDEVYQPILKACKDGDVVAALNVLGSLSSIDYEKVPVQVRCKVLLSAAKVTLFTDDLIAELHRHKRLLADICSFEAACAEASRWRNVAVCRQLFDLSYILDVARTERSITLLVRGHSNNPAAMKLFLEDVSAR
jgi:hypothetical protein